MQTFLPYADFEGSARVLDAKRLGKQRVEVIQIVRAISIPGYGWASHPAVLMWKGYEEALGRYGLTMCEVWIDLGFGDTCAATIANDLRRVGVERFRTQDELAESDELPPWLGMDDLHRSHQSALIRKDPERYGPLFPGVPGDIDYLWPVRSQKVIDLERKRSENAILREERARMKAEKEAEKAKRKRSSAARKAWRTRKTNARVTSEPRTHHKPD